MSTPTEQHDFLHERLATWEAYHNHKEGMAYAAAALWVGAAAAALVVDRWPPPWVGACLTNRFWAAVVVSLAWFLMLSFLRWQLRNRRWAAIQVAGLERYLAGELWTKHHGIETPRPKPGWFVDGFWWFVGLAHGESIVPDVCANVYPEKLQEEWKRQCEAGTGAVENEHVLFLAGWLFWLLLVVRTLAY